MPITIDGMTCYTVEEARAHSDMKVQENIRKWDQKISLAR